MPCSDCADRGNLENLESFQTMLDRLGNELRSPFLELARSLQAPLPVTEVPGRATFDTLTLNDTTPRPIIGQNPLRRSITLVNAGASTITVSANESQQGGALVMGTFALLSGDSLTLPVSHALWVAGPVGAILSWVSVEVAT